MQLSPKMLLLQLVLLLVAAISTSLSSDTGRSGLVISIDTSGQYSLQVNGVTWLTNGDTFFRSDGKQFSTADSSLKLLNTSAISGYDKFGQWQSTQFMYQAGKVYVLASIKTYIEPDLPLVIFSQKYLSPAQVTSSLNGDHVISSFPSFKVGGQPLDLGYLAYGGDMAGYDWMSTGQWNSEATFTTGMRSGPIILFDNTTNAMVISSLSQFMASSNQYDKRKNQMYYGIMGAVDSVPSDYETSAILYYSDAGINKAMEGWGSYLRFLYGKDARWRNKDISLNYTGYWTDNGAYYYYVTEKGKNYQDTVVDIVNYFRRKEIPFKYMQYDSWWYPKGLRSGTETWWPMKKIFPGGFKYVYNKTDLPFGCHNRYWDSDVTYAKFNGGKFHFIKDPLSGLTLPDDDTFWLFLFQQTQEWGNFFLYEQDWLNIQTEATFALQSDLDLGRRWLEQMGRNAEKFGISIQYCMAYSRHILQSLEIPAVTQARASEDYQPGKRQWDIGITSMFIHAVGLAPSKDTFWTTAVQPGNRYHAVENNTVLNHLVATLSTGPVGPGDMIGALNKSLIMRCCDSEGRILQPSKPATAIDDQIIKGTFPSYPGPQGQVWTSYSKISNNVFGIVLATEMENQYSLTPEAGWSGQLAPSVVYGQEPWASHRPVEFSSQHPLALGADCSAERPCVFYTSPTILVLTVNQTAVLLGEEGKWVPMSSQRFPRIQSTADDLLVDVNVNAGETVNFQYILGALYKAVTCDNTHGSRPQTGNISVRQGVCTFP